MVKEEELKTIIAKVKSGNQEAFEELYDATVGDVYKNVYFLLDHKGVIDDLVQDIYIHVYRSLKKYNPDRPFKPWLIGVAVNQVKSYRRKDWMHGRLSRKAAENERWKETRADMMVEENDDLYRAVNALPYKLKQVIILRYLNDYTQEEIAAVLNIPLGTVKSRIHAGLKRLRTVSGEQQILLRRVDELS
ncbi:sigma-70 family RNA polymerase sigma factor [Bacillus sp. KH172YL63]|uniref:sigma-70 family RNA polymerase sigma factor n=1 Tax=Bacillus sp. KH172YL63 TaxID=2709784 RepID=UPI0013E51780|nr:sigma-70 family RNA polymerase sigma factor [Bacillus sp. KH172YL63]BCB02704.1 RNA polymerase sigma factor [Bacillus sp. KH172YL63]